MALVFTLTVPPVKMSGALAFEFPETTLLSTEMAPAPPVRAMPPP